MEHCRSYGARTPGQAREQNSVQRYDTSDTYGELRPQRGEVHLLQEDLEAGVGAERVVVRLRGQVSVSSWDG